MTRDLSLGKLSAFFLLALCCSSQADAQGVMPPNQPPFQFPKLEAFPFNGPAMQPGFGNGPSVNWGGLRFKKANPELQEELGLAENEGMVVAAVDANSVAAKAGLKTNDVLVKINDKSVPNDLKALVKLVKDQKAEEPVEFVVLRKGKEEMIKGVRMPAIALANPNPFGNAFQAQGGLFAVPPFQFNPGLLPNQGNIVNLQLEMVVDGAKIVRKQTEDTFSGEYTKDDFKIAVNGKITKGLPSISEIAVQNGKTTKKYTRLEEMPLQQRVIVQLQLMPSSSPFLMFPLQGMPFQLQGFPMFPAFPELNPE